MIRSKIAIFLFVSLFGSHALHAQESLELKVINIFEANCANSSCHAGPAPQNNLDLSPERFYGYTVNEPSQDKPDILRVLPGNAEESYLVKKIKGSPGIAGLPMPYGGDKITKEEIATIEEWINGLEEIDTKRKNRELTKEVYPFLGFRNLNLPTTRTLDRNTGLFAINHRFNPPISDGFDGFFGLDGSATIFFQLGYGITDDLSVFLGRANASDNIELNVRQRIGKQSIKNWPLNLSLQGNLNWIAEKPSDPDLSRLRSEVLKPSLQVIATRQFYDQFSLLFSPGILFNPDENISGEDPMITLGIGGRWNFKGKMSIFGEWVPIVSGYTLTETFGNLNRFDSWGTGFEIATAGHVFQILLTNSVGLATDQYFRGGDLDPNDFFEGDIRIGFNISRVLNFKKKAK